MGELPSAGGVKPTKQTPMDGLVVQKPLRARTMAPPSVVGNLVKTPASNKLYYSELSRRRFGWHLGELGVKEIQAKKRVYQGKTFVLFIRC